MGGEHCARQCGSDAVGGGVAEEGGCAPRLDKGDDAEARRVEGDALLAVAARGARSGRLLEQKPVGLGFESHTNLCS